MKIVYDANNTLDAHVVKHMLENEGIEAHIQGEYLQGGVGELSAMNLVKVSVSENDFTKARAIIEEWDSQQTDTGSQSTDHNGAERAQRGWSGFLIFVAGFLVGAVLTYQRYCI